MNNSICCRAFAVKYSNSVAYRFVICVIHFFFLLVQQMQYVRFKWNFKFTWLLSSWISNGSIVGSFHRDVVGAWLRLPVMSVIREAFFLCHQADRKPHDVPQFPTANPINDEKKLRWERKLIKKMFYGKENKTKMMKWRKILIERVARQCYGMMYFIETKQHS